MTTSTFLFACSAIAALGMLALAIIAAIRIRRSRPAAVTETTPRIRTSPPVAWAPIHDSIQRVHSRAKTDRR